MYLTTNQREQITAYLKEKRVEILSLWEDLVELESYSREPHEVAILANRLKMEFTVAGLDCDLVDVKANGPTLVGMIGVERPTKSIIFSGHYDTVFPKGSFGKKFQILDDKAYGPGVLDMKGGIVISLYVIKALNELGYDGHPIKIVFSGDEEIGHSGSCGGEAIMNLAKYGLFAFNMETGLPNNSLCIGRKGSITCTINVTGKESHAGNDFTSGRNAIEEMAHKIIALQALTDLEVGTTVNVGTIKGGTVSNAVAGACSIEVNIRILKKSEEERMLAEVKKIAEQCHVEGTTGQLSNIRTMPLYETTEGVKAFHAFVNQVAKENHLPEMGGKVLGGSSDASYLTMAGVPTLCSFGVRGQWNHTVNEYAFVESLFERIELITAIILSADEFAL